MKRNITQLEEKLLNQGWKLTSKTYKGKESQLTECYVYSKIIDFEYDEFCFEARLNCHRDKIIAYHMVNCLPIVSVDYCKDIQAAFDIVKDLLFEY